MLQKVKRLFSNRWLKRITFFLLIWIVAHIIYISIDGFNNYNGSADVAIILGNHVYAGGSLSPWLKGRVDEALRLYKEGKVKKIYASGGISENDEGNYPEGDAMKNYLLLNGVAADDVIADNRGQNTFLTAKDFIAWNKDYHYTSAIVVSQFYHVTRSKYILRKLGFKNVYSTSSKKYAWADVFSTLREVLAFYKYMVVY